MLIYKQQSKSSNISAVVNFDFKNKKKTEYNNIKLVKLNHIYHQKILKIK